jgi:hypothetical protein
LDKLAEGIILANSRFRLFRTRSYQIEIIRISINKPEISFQIRIIKEGGTNKFYLLLFLVNNTIKTKVVKEVKKNKKTCRIKVKVPVLQIIKQPNQLFTPGGISFLGIPDIREFGETRGIKIPSISNTKTSNPQAGVLL